MQDIEQLVKLNADGTCKALSPKETFVRWAQIVGQQKSLGLELDQIPQLLERVKLRALNRQVTGQAQKHDQLQAELTKLGTRVDHLSEDLNKKKVHFSDTLEQQERTVERLEALEEICNSKKPDVEKTVAKLLEKSMAAF